jgi:hypothetical protein
MVKRLLTVLFLSVLVLSLSAPLLAQDSKAKPKKHARWEGSVTIVSKDKTTFVVRKTGTAEEKTISFDAMTVWESQEHGKKPNKIDASQVKEGDRVIVVGDYAKDGTLHATTISKRLTPQAHP